MPKKAPVNPASTNELSPFPEKGPVSARIETASAAMSIYKTLWNADKVSAWNRAQVQGLVDGNPPFPRGATRRLGQANKTNLDFGEAGAQVDASLSAYYDLIEGVEVLAHHILPQELGDEREELESTIDEEMERMVRRNWSDFYPRWDINSREFVTHGVSFCYFGDDDDWRWDCGGLDDFLLPRGTRVSEEEFEVLVGIREQPVHKVYAWIKDEEAAKAIGWNVDAVKQELVSATKGWKNRQKWTDHWTEVQRMLKNNDFGVSYSGAEAKTVRLIHFWVREFSGKVSHYITSGEERGTANQEFLYQKFGRFHAAPQAFVSFTNGVGNGQIHSIRGLGFRLYPGMMELNQLRCRLLDHVKYSSALIFKRGQNAKLDEPALSLNGGLGVLGPDTDIVQTAIQDKSDGLIKVSNELSNIVQTNTGNYRPRGVNVGNQEKTKYEVMQQSELENRLNVSQVNLFYRSWGRLMKEVFRRVQKIGPTQIERNDGTVRFPEVQEFFERCASRGVPPEVIAMVKDVLPERAIGNGSPGQRQAQLDRLGQMAGSFDERSLNHYRRDAVTAILGDRSRVDRYVPKPQDVKPVLDHKMALFENNDMELGQPADRLVGENDAIHAQIHMGAIQEAVQRLEQMRMAGQTMDIENVMPDLKFLQVAIPHNAEHVDALSRDPLRAPLYGEMRQVMQNASASYFTYVRQAEQILSERQQANADSAQPDEEQQRKDAELQDKLRRLWVESKTKQQITVDESNTKIAIKRAEADAKLAASIRKDQARAPL